MLSHSVQSGLGRGPANSNACVQVQSSVLEMGVLGLRVGYLGFRAYEFWNFEGCLDFGVG